MKFMGYILVSSEKFVTNLDWNLLRTFVVIVDEGSITNAASRLLRRQPTVSAALRRLETQIGNKLIERGGGTFRLTAAGRGLHRECIELYGNIARLEDLTHAASKEMTGNIRILLASHVVTPILYKALSEFHREHPSVTFSIDVEASRDVTQGVLEKSAALGICLLDRRLAKLDYELIYREYFGFFCGPTHPLYGRENLTLEDLRQCSGVSFETDSMEDALRSVAKFRKLHDLNHNIVGHSANLEEVRRMIVCGLGIGPLPIHVVAQDVDAKSLWRLPPYINPPAVDIFVVTNPKNRLSRAEFSFVTVLKQLIVGKSVAERTYTSDSKFSPIT